MMWVTVYRHEKEEKPFVGFVEGKNQGEAFSTVAHYLSEKYGDGVHMVPCRIEVRKWL